MKAKYLNSINSIRAELGISCEAIREFKTALDEHAIVASMDAQGEITYVNERFCRVSQYTEDELLGQDHRILNSNHHSESFIKDLRETIQSGRVWRGEIRNRRKDGSYFWVATTIVPFMDEGGVAERYIAIGSNITVSKELEAQLVEISEKERIRIGQDLHDDLCQRLAALKLACGTAARNLERDGNEQAGMLRKIETEMGEATAMSRTIAGGLSPLSLKGKGLMASLDKLVEGIEGRFGIPCRFDCPIPVAVGNPKSASHVFRIAQELMNNSAKHAHPTHILLGLYPAGGGFKIEVVNDGIPFHDPGKDGGGMGLHFMRSRADSIGASLEFIQGKLPDGGTRVICLVPDRRETKITLSENDGYECCWTAGDAVEAMTRLEKKRPDLLIVDMTLPGRNGLELIKDGLSVAMGMPILVVSMHDETLYAQRVLRAGAKGYLMKDASRDLLVEAIRRVAEGGIWVSSAMSKMIIQAFSGHGGSDAVEGVHRLTDREFEIFQLIGEGKSKGVISAMLNISTKTVDVHKAHIREKLEMEDAAAVLSYAVRWVEMRRLKPK